MFETFLSNNIYLIFIIRTSHLFGKLVLWKPIHFCLNRVMCLIEELQMKMYSLRYIVSLTTFTQLLFYCELNIEYLILAEKIKLIFIYNKF